MPQLPRLPRRSSILALLILLAPSVSAQKPDSTANWASFRGPNAVGMAEGAPLPIEWDVEASKNVLWKTGIPGLGNSSPVIWGDRLQWEFGSSPVIYKDMVLVQCDVLKARSSPR